MPGFTCFGLRIANHRTLEITSIDFVGIFIACIILVGIFFRATGSAICGPKSSSV